MKGLVLSIVLFLCSVNVNGSSYSLNHFQITQVHNDGHFCYGPEKRPIHLLISSPTIQTQNQVHYGKHELASHFHRLQALVAFFAPPMAITHSLPLQTAGRNPSNTDESISSPSTEPCLRPACCRHFQAAASESRSKKKSMNTKCSASRRTRKRCVSAIAAKRARRSTPIPVRTISRRRRYRRRNAPRQSMHPTPPTAS